MLVFHHGKALDINIGASIALMPACSGSPQAPQFKHQLGTGFYNFNKYFIKTVKI